MSYAEHRKIIDADSHVIELEDFLISAAKEEDKSLIPSMSSQKELPVVEAGLERGKELFKKRQEDPELMAKFDEAILDNTKSGWNRVGAFDPSERSHALDVFGYSIQWVLPTFSFHQIAHSDDPKVLEVGSKTLNRAMAEFCKSDERLKAIGYVPLQLGPEKSLEILQQGFDEGCYSFMIDTNEPNEKNISFTHPDFDPIWKCFVEHKSPFVVHVAVNGHYKAVPGSFKNNGKTELELGGDAPAGEVCPGGGARRHDDVAARVRVARLLRMGQGREGPPAPRVRGIQGRPLRAEEPRRERPADAAHIQWRPLGLHGRLVAGEYSADPRAVDVAVAQRSLLLSRLCQCGRQTLFFMWRFIAFFARVML